MKVLFLEIDTVRKWALASVGPAYIASYVREHGHDAGLLRVPPDMGHGEIVAAIENEKPDFLGLSLTNRQWLRAREVVGNLRESLDIPVVAGGLFPTFEPDAVLARDGFDWVCLGEGEEAMLSLLSGEAPDTAACPNLWVKGGSRPKLSPPAASLDDMPFMARDLLDEEHGVHHMVTQRGCTFPCTFCAASAIRSLYEPYQFCRRRTVRSVLDELAEVAAAGPLNYVIFLDDTFTTDREWVREFCRGYQEEIGAGFSINARVETVGPKMIGELKAAGLTHIAYGVESGSPRVRREILKRPVDDTRIKDAFRWTKEHGVLATANYMLGMPGESAEEIEMTLALNRELGPDDFGYFVFYPYPGTHLFDVCRDGGFLPENYLDLPANNRESILTLPDLAPSDIIRYYDEFTAAREELYLNRRGSDLKDEERAGVVAMIRESAGQG